jgi:hypothetical protein
MVLTALRPSAVLVNELTPRRTAKSLAVAIDPSLSVSSARRLRADFLGEVFSRPAEESAGCLIWALVRNLCCPKSPRWLGGHSKEASRLN